MSHVDLRDRRSEGCHRRLTQVPLRVDPGEEVGDLCDGCGERLHLGVLVGAPSHVNANQIIVSPPRGLRLDRGCYELCCLV